MTITERTTTWGAAILFSRRIGVLLLSLIALGQPLVSAQGSSSTVQGIVEDSTGGAISRAQITLRSSSGRVVATTYGVRSSIDFRGHGWDTSVLVDGNTGRLRSVDLARGQHLGNSIFNLLWGIHFADLRDWLPYRILVCLFGLFLGVISYTGVYIWWKKRKTRQVARSHAREFAHQG